MQQSVIIIGIETSCDDTSAAVIKDGKILANFIANQDIHEQYGGVVPELASRAHQQNIIPVIDHALKTANISIEDVNAIAFTRGPGLLGSLLVGTSFAKGLSLALDVPLVEVHHMQAHILAHFIKEKDGSGSAPSFPFLCLTVSGGHTQIVKVKGHFDMEVIGKTLDDAAGEAFDKIAKMLGLPYPGGPVIDQYARKGNPEAFQFTHPDIPGLDYSFSGLKTAFLYFVRDRLKENPEFVQQNINDLCASAQKTIIDILMHKLKKAATLHDIDTIAIAGGVSANSRLRNTLEAQSKISGWNIFIPKFEYCTDNAAMIAITGYYKYFNKNFASQDTVPRARMQF